MRLFPLTTILLASALLSCSSPKHPPVDKECATACDRLRKMEPHCALGDPTAEGVTCEQWCTKYGDRNRRHGTDVDCLARAATCEAADKCTR